MRTIPVSEETKLIASKSPNRRVEVYSFFPNDRADCECQKKEGLVVKWKEKLAILPEGKRRELVEQTKFLVCPRDKTGMSRYEITCGTCGETLGYCWASDGTLGDFCDFHYVSWADRKGWHGCFTPHISPITQQLCFECTCGQDTRDFRANMTLPEKTTNQMEKSNSVGREFRKTDSKFKTRIVGNDVLPFNLKRI